MSEETGEEFPEDFDEMLETGPAQKMPMKNSRTMAREAAEA